MVRGEPPIDEMKPGGDFPPYVPPRRNRGESASETDFRKPFLLGAGLLLAVGIGVSGYAYGRGGAVEETARVAPLETASVPVAPTPSELPTEEPPTPVVEPTLESEPEQTDEFEPTEEPTRKSRDFTFDQDGELQIDGDSPLGRLYATGKGNIKITVKERGGDKFVRACGSVVDLVLKGQLNSEGLLGEAMDWNFTGENCIEYHVDS